jgi:hypothetical protein
MGEDVEQDLMVVGDEDAGKVRGGPRGRLDRSAHDDAK